MAAIITANRGHSCHSQKSGEEQVGEEMGADKKGGKDSQLMERSGRGNAEEKSEAEVEFEREGGKAEERAGEEEELRMWRRGRQRQKEIQKNGGRRGDMRSFLENFFFLFM